MSDSESSYTTVTDSGSTSSDDVILQEDNIQLEGCVLKNYNIICELGRGGFSIVWLAYSINTLNYYALKVQNPKEYKDGLLEIKFVQRLPKEPAVFNNLIEYFIEERNNKKYLCSVWELHCSNLDCIMRKGKYPNGLPLRMIKSIMEQVITGVNILHNDLKVFHGDIKTDNILIKGISKKNKFIIENYNEHNFYERYRKAKEQLWVNSGKSVDTINTMKKEVKLKLRAKIHKEINDIVLLKLESTEISSYDVDDKYLDDIKISIADFGTHCTEDDYYTEPFGTRYYFAPEVILMGKCSYPVDIWEIGCMFYELVTGQILFDPIKDSKHTRDYYHLCLINDTCGEFPKEFLRKTEHYKEFFDSKFRIKNYIPEEDRLSRKLKECNISDEIYNLVYIFLSNCLQIDPKKRRFLLPSS